MAKAQGSGEDAYIVIEKHTAKQKEQLLKIRLYSTTVMNRSL